MGLFSHLTLVLLATSVFAQQFLSDLQQLGFKIALPGTGDYVDASSAYNQRFEVFPSAITYPKSTQEVSDILKVCHEYGIPTVARSGGHSYVANSLGGTDGAVVIDLSNFKQLDVDDASNIATIGTGNRLGDIVSGLNAKNRALPHGTCKMVGIGGHASFGGYGFTSRKWGLTLDTVERLEVVFANGTIATLSKDESPDIFWGFRGAAPSFGIVTTIQATTFEEPASATVINIKYDLSADEAADALGAFEAHSRAPDLPQEYGAEITISKGTSKGRVSFSVVGGWYGPADELSPVLQPFLDKIPGKPVADNSKAGSYVDSILALDGSGSLDTSKVGHDTFIARSLTIRESKSPSIESFTSEARKAYTAYLGDKFDSVEEWFCQVELYGGTNSEINKVHLEDTAFGHRDAIFILQLYAYSKDSKPPFPPSAVDFVNGVVDSIATNSPAETLGTYANYIENNLDDWEHKYYGTNYEKLQRLKTELDPKDIFRFPTSIRGTTGTTKASSCRRKGSGS